MLNIVNCFLFLKSIYILHNFSLIILGPKLIHIKLNNTIINNLNI